MNYNYVIDSSFQPFSMQEMLVPLTAYKDAYEKDEERYLELQNKAGDLAAVVASLPEESAVRKQYENYYNELNKRAKEFSNNGKSFSTGKALLDLRRRYQGEIGSIEKANNALNEELKLRRTIMAQDPTMLYNMENPTLENYMPGAKRNDYSISGNYLSAEGAKMGEALSKRMFATEEGKNNILGGYYIDYVQRTGVRDTKAFMQSPEFAEAMKEDLMSKGVYDNLSGNNLQRAIDAYRSGAMKGFVYSESHSPQRDLGKMTATEAANDANAKAGLALQRSNQEMTAKSAGYKWENGHWVDDPNSIGYQQRQMAYAENKARMDTLYEKDPTTGNYKLKDGVIPEGMFIDPDGKLRNKPKEGTEKAEKIKLKENKKMDSSGNTVQLGSQSNQVYGKRTNFDDLSEEQKEWAITEDPDNYKYYDYYVNGKEVFRIRAASEIDKPNSSSSTATSSSATPVTPVASNDNALGFYWEKFK